MFSLIVICGTYVAYQKMLILAKIGPDSSGNTSEIARNQKVQVFLPVKEPLVATFSETRAVISPKDKCEKEGQKGMKILKAWEKDTILRLHFSVFTLKIDLNMLIFEDLFTFKMASGDYFLWNKCSQGRV